MKVEVNEIKDEKKIEFPCLMIAGDGAIILATRITKSGIHGTLIVESKPIVYDIGVFCDDWDENTFKPFNGTITLSND